MSSSSSVTSWLCLLKAGDGTAAQRLWQEYFGRLVHLARQHLAQNVCRAADEEDVALAAVADFCRGAASGRFPRLNDRHDLWRLLLTLTIRHAAGLARRETRGRHAAGPADLLDLPQADLDRLAGDSPDPALAAAVADQVRRLLTVLPGEDLRAAAQDLLAGYTAAEMAHRRGCSLRTIERRWQRIRQVWEPLLESDDPA
jgi:DNA-directed RNA polymerase specialized sigma24 family protein